MHRVHPVGGGTFKMKFVLVFSLLFGGFYCQSNFPPALPPQASSGVGLPTINRVASGIPSDPSSLPAAPPIPAPNQLPTVAPELPPPKLPSVPSLPVGSALPPPPSGSSLTAGSILPQLPSIPSLPSGVSLPSATPVSSENTVTPPNSAGQSSPSVSLTTPLIPTPSSPSLSSLPSSSSTLSGGTLPISPPGANWLILPPGASKPSLPSGWSWQTSPSGWQWLMPPPSTQWPSPPFGAQNPSGVSSNTPVSWPWPGTSPPSLPEGWLWPTFPAGWPVPTSGNTQPSTPSQLSNTSSNAASPLIPLLPSQQQERNETIERPCEIFDIYCIRRFFGDHANCKEMNRPVPDPYYRAQSSIYLARINVTFISNNVIYRGLNGRISEFYVNRDTDNLVMAIEFRNLAIESDNTYFRFHRRGQEPIVNNDFLNMLYSSVESTIIIPNLKDLQLERSEVFTYVNDASPLFDIGPNAFLSADPSTALTMVEFLANIPSNVREKTLTRGPFLPATYIQYTICDFGLEIL